MSSKSLRDQLIVGFASAVVLAGALASSHPLFVVKTAIVQRLLARGHADASGESVPAWVALSPEAAVRTPQFLADRQSFADDLLRTGKVDRERAWALADVAVRQAYRRRLPPALVLGVMLTENDELKSSARSNVGAIGLMQIDPGAWRSLGKIFGSNLKNDSTNLKYGIYILDFLAEKASRSAGDRESALRSALLGYNGCKTGRNTKDCHRYPDVVERAVMKNARYSCAGKAFVDCVTHPLWLANRGTHSAP
jgi:soluble lytic murein transglycosylase-like protein